MVRFQSCFDTSVRWAKGEAILLPPVGGAKGGSFRRGKFVGGNVRSFGRMRELGSVDKFVAVSEEGFWAWEAAHKVEMDGCSRSLMFDYASVDGPVGNDDPRKAGARKSNQKPKGRRRLSAPP